MVLRVVFLALFQISVLSPSFADAQDAGEVRFTQARLRPENNPLAQSLTRALRTRRGAFYACFEHRAADRARQGVVRIHLHFGVRSPTSTTMAIHGAGRLGIDEGLSGCIQREVVRAVSTFPVQHHRYRARVSMHIDVPHNGEGQPSAERLRIEERARRAQVESSEAIVLASAARRRSACLFRAASELRTAAAEHADAGGTRTSTRRLESARASLAACRQDAGVVSASNEPSLSRPQQQD